jgi:murein DD-endopeptidase MepM/ murein hydrolase activator NlpD
VKTLGSITTAVFLVAFAPASALAADTNGGATYEPAPASTKPAPSPTKPAPVKKPSSPSARPALAAFSVSPSVLTPGQAPIVSFTVKGRAPTIRLRLVVSWPGTGNAQRTIDLGRVSANTDQSVTLNQLVDPSLPEGEMAIRITGRDSAGRILRPGAHLSRVAQIQVRGHVFPLRGEFSYGGPDAKFGAKRNGHTHQGQDIFAAEGLPVVAPRAGTIEYVQFQEGGAGWYVVLHGDGEDYDYAFMHLQENSIPVVKGEHVDQGQRLGSVGHTGDAQGNHLHFEVWQGAWFNGGHAIDPLPFLEQWQQWSPVRAT